MLTTGLIGTNKEIESFFSSLTKEQKRAVAGLHIIGDTYDECSAKLQKPSFQTLEHFPDETEVLLVLSGSEQSFQLAISGLKLGKDIVMAKYSDLDLEKIERLEKLSKEAERTFFLLPNTDFLQPPLDPETPHTYYIHRERYVSDIKEASLFPVLYTDLLQLYKLSKQGVDRIKVLSSPKLMNANSPITLLINFANGMHCSLVYSQASKRNLFILYQGQEVRTIEHPLNKPDETQYNRKDAKVVAKLISDTSTPSGLQDASIIKQAMLCVKEMIK
ncbi:MAG: hypothetical protein ACQESW_01935 [Bacteroidota bacterium]|jgi:hypothetical protein